MRHVDRVGRRSLIVAAVLSVASCLSGCAGLSNAISPLPVVQSVDVSRYMGRWYEIARYPNSFEQGCSAVTADYSLKPDGTVRVVNTCRSDDGRRTVRIVEGTARITDRQTNAKLDVVFFFPFGAPYWIIDLDPDYGYAVVGEPTRKFLWILARQPAMDAGEYADILTRLPPLGYEPARVELTPQPPIVSD